jgi:hypothetical protein
MAPTFFYPFEVRNIFGGTDIHNNKSFGLVIVLEKMIQPIRTKNFPYWQCFCRIKMKWGLFVEVLINTIPAKFDRKIYNLPILLKESSCLPHVNELHTYYIKQSRQYYMTTMSPPTLVGRHIVFVPAILECL